MEAVSAFVLAGGKSSRMGADKAFVELGARRLLDRALELAGVVASDVRIVGSAGKFARFGRVVEDEFPNCGPLGGIHAALQASQTELNFVLAVDLPFVEAGFLRYLLTEAQASKAVVTVPRAGGGWQPLCAVYRREFAAVAETALRRSKYKIDPLFGLVEVRALDDDELKKCGFSPDMFRNLNTPEELGEASREVARTAAPDSRQLKIKQGEY
jgi:molybdopterin-guanine dinucleotide biosynthesis protein A